MCSEQAVDQNCDIFEDESGPAMGAGFIYLCNRRHVPEVGVRHCECGVVESCAYFLLCDRVRSCS